MYVKCDDYYVGDSLSNMVMYHEFCMNVYDHVFIQAFREMQIRVQLGRCTIVMSSTTDIIVTVLYTLQTMKRCMISLRIGRHGIDVD